MVSSIVIAESGDGNSPFPLIGNIPDHIRMVAALGFDGVELQISNPGDYMECLAPVLKKSRICVTSIATGLSCKEGLSMTSGREAVRQKTMGRLKEYMDLASGLGENIIIHIGLIRGRLEAGVSQGEYLGYLKSGLCELADYGALSHTSIAVEPINHRDADMLHTWEETVRVLEEVSRPNIGISVDLYHMRMEEKNIMDTLHRHKKWVRIIQLMDENRWYPGGGMLRFEPLLHWMREIAYDGPVVMECLPRPDRETAIRKWLEFYHQYVGG